MKKQKTQVIEYSDAALQLLKTNEQPHEDFVFAEIRRGELMRDALDEEIKQVQAQVHSHQEQLKSLRGQISGLQTKRRSVLKFIKDHQTIVSPLRRNYLPIEIWTLIFHHVDPTVDILLRNIRNAKGIWALGRVCSQWRAAVLSSQSLWSKLFIPFDESNLKCAPLLEQILARSKNASLEFSLDVQVSRTYFDSERLMVPPSVVDRYLPPVIRMLTANSNRWHTASIKGVPEQQLSLFSEVRGHLPLLQHLSYECSTHAIGLEVAPSLQKLVISGARTLNSLSLANMSLPWSQIRECKICQIRALDHELDVLRLCTNLEAYSLSAFSRWPKTRNLSPHMAHLPKLHTLSLFVSSGMGLLNNLILPSLSSLILETDEDFDECYDEAQEEGHAGVVTRLNGLLSRSSCKLTVLKIKNGSRIAEPLLGSVNFVYLTSLHMTYDASDGIPADILTVKSRSHEIALPRLENLHLRPSYKRFKRLSPVYLESIDLTPLVEVVRSRWRLTERRRKEISRLSFVEYRNAESSFSPPRPLAGALAPLLTFREEGLGLGVDNFFLEAM